jgi:cation:H+ antiporter
MVLGGLLPDATPVQVAAIVVATGLIWVGSGYLERAAEELSAYYGLPAVVQGSIVVAVGSSFPELAGVVVTALSGSFGMGVGVVVGSAVFNVLLTSSHG